MLLGMWTYDLLYVSFLLSLSEISFVFRQSGHYYVEASSCVTSVRMRGCASEGGLTWRAARRGFPPHRAGTCPAQCTETGCRLLSSVDCTVHCRPWLLRIHIALSVGWQHVTPFSPTSLMLLGIRVFYNSVWYYIEEKSCFAVNIVELHKFDT